LFPYINWKHLSMNEGITISDIENNMDRPWDWGYISYNPNINIDFVKRHRDKPFERLSLLINPGIELKDILENKSMFIPDSDHEKWIWRIVSSNPNLTLAQILQYPQLQNFEELSSNYFDKNPLIRQKRISQKKLIISEILNL
jgi:hypothetical protein